VPERTIEREDLATLDLRTIETEAGRCLNCGCVAVNAGDLAPALLALGAVVKTTARTLPAAELFGAGTATTTVLEPGEVVTRVEIPPLPAGAKQSYLKFRVRNAIDFPIVGLASLFVLKRGRFEAARLALGAVAPLPFRATAVEEFLLGKKPTDDVAEVAASLAVKGAEPLAGNAYKLQVVRALVKQAVLGAAKG
jgi:CO/xanthine dehydrogenase FAD-binding subunit